MRSTIRAATVVTPVVAMLVRTTGSAAAIVPDPDRVDFGRVPPNSTETRDLAVTIDAGYWLSGAAVDGGGFVVDPDTCRPGTQYFHGPGTCNVMVSLTPRRPARSPAGIPIVV